MKVHVAKRWTNELLQCLQIDKKSTWGGFFVGKDVFNVRVFPEVDYAFIVSLLIILQEIISSSNDSWSAHHHASAASGISTGGDWSPYRLWLRSFDYVVKLAYLIDIRNSTISLFDIRPQDYDHIEYDYAFLLVYNIKWKVHPYPTDLMSVTM